MCEHFRRMADERQTFRQLIRNFARSVPPARLAKVFAEEYVGTFLRALPGVEGFVLRYLLYRVLFRRLGGFCYVYPGARLSHVYGIEAGRNLMINAGAFVYGRGGLRFGDDVMIGPNTVIVSSQHRFDNPHVPIVFQGSMWAPADICNGGCVR